MTLVKLFYAKAKFVGVMIFITSSLRGIDFELNADRICDKLRILVVGKWMYETKTWARIEGFVSGEAVLRICDLQHAKNMAKLNAGFVSKAKSLSLLARSSTTHAMKLIEVHFRCYSFFYLQLNI